MGWGGGELEDATATILEEIDCSSDEDTDTYSGTGLESKVCVRATIGLFECISEPNFRSLFAYVCSKPGVSFNTSMWMDHTNKP